MSTAFGFSASFARIQVEYEVTKIECLAHVSRGFSHSRSIMAAFCATKHGVPTTSSRARSALSILRRLVFANRLIGIPVSLA